MSDPWLETPRLRARPFARRDVDALHALWIDPVVRRWLFDDKIVARAWVLERVGDSMHDFARRGFGMFTVFERGKDARPIGFCGYTSREDPPELMYGVLPSRQGRGLITEIAREVLRWGFEVHGFTKVVAGADPLNLASIRVMQKLGMRFVGTRDENGVQVNWFEIDAPGFAAHAREPGAAAQE